MKNLLLYINPRKDFDEECKIAIKIQIDNSLDLGWKREDIMLVTNFPYEYNGINALIVGDENYCDFYPCVSKINTIIDLLKKGLIEKGVIYWFHDIDAYQLYKITESELNLGKVDMALTDKGFKPRFSTGSIFFKSSTEDIFRWVKEIAYKYQGEEELPLTALYTNNLLWMTEAERYAQDNSVPFNIPGIENLPDRIKKLNIRYNFGDDDLYKIYPLAAKPIKVAHFHFSSDIPLDSFMYGKNSINKPLLPKRLIKIFQKHGVFGLPKKKMKNLMVYTNPEKKFPKQIEKLIKMQIDNSLKMGWNKQDLVLLTNFPYSYKGIKAKVIDDKLLASVNGKTLTSAVIYELLLQNAIGEGELWWFHELHVFQRKLFESDEIELEATTAGFVDFGSFFFRNGSNKLFEWIRNRTIRLNADEATALGTLAETNYRNINYMYKKLKLVKIFKHL